MLHEVLRKAWCKMIDVTSTFGGNKEVAKNSRIYFTAENGEFRGYAEGFATKARRHKVSRMGFTQSTQRGKGAKVLF